MNASGRKLTTAQVREIRETCGIGGVTQRMLAHRFGVSQTAIWYALRGRNWSCVDTVLEIREHSQAGTRPLCRASEAEIARLAGLGGATAPSSPVKSADQPGTAAPAGAGSCVATSGHAAGAAKDGRNVDMATTDATSDAEARVTRVVLCETEDSRPFRGLQQAKQEGLKW